MTSTLRVPLIVAATLATSCCLALGVSLHLQSPNFGESWRGTSISERNLNPFVEPDQAPSHFYRRDAAADPAATEQSREAITASQQSPESGNVGEAQVGSSTTDGSGGPQEEPAAARVQLSHSGYEIPSWIGRDDGIESSVVISEPNKVVRMLHKLSHDITWSLFKNKISDQFPGYDIADPSVLRELAKFRKELDTKGWDNSNRWIADSELI